MFSCEFCKISKNTFFAQHLQTTSSEKIHKKALAGDTWLKNCSEKINKILEANRPKVVNLKPGTTLIKDFAAGDFLGIQLEFSKQLVYKTPVVAASVLIQQNRNSFLVKFFFTYIANIACIYLINFLNIPTSECFKCFLTWNF